MGKAREGRIYGERRIKRLNCREKGKREERRDKREGREERRKNRRKNISARKNM